MSSTRIPKTPRAHDPDDAGRGAVFCVPSNPRDAIRKGDPNADLACPPMASLSVVLCVRRLSHYRSCRGLWAQISTGCGFLAGLLALSVQ